MAIGENFYGVGWGTSTGSHTHNIGIGVDMNTISAGPDSIAYLYGSPVPKEDENKKEENYEMKTLYNVYLVYGEDRKNPIIREKKGIIADSEEDAKIKSGLMREVDESWDADYLTFIVEEIGEVKIKPKPKEVKNI